MRACGAGAEGDYVGGQIHHAVGGNNRARIEIVLDGAIDSPAGQIDGPRIAVGDLDIFLRLVPGGRVVIHGHNLDR